MKSVLMFVLLLSSVVLSTRATAETSTRCNINDIPAGWITTDMYYDSTQCNTPYPPILGQANVLLITRYNNLPLGSTLNVCSQAWTGIQGWTQGPWHYEPTICGCPYPGGCTPFANNAYTITHATCVAGQTNCSPTGSITASPQQLTVPYHGAGTTYVTYSFSATPSVCVWVSETGATPTLWRCGGASSNIAWPYVPWGGTSKFFLSTSGTSPSPTLATFTVTGLAGAQPTFSINPSHVIVPIGQTSGPFSFTWNAPGYPSLDLWGQVNTNPWGFIAIPASSSSGDNITVGNTYTYRFYAPGSPGPMSSQPNQGLLGTLTTYASH